jgi:hypothetical protein
MKRIYKSLLLLALIFPLAYAQTSMDNELAALRNALSEKTIASIVVLRLADDVTTRTNVTPQWLRKIYPPTRKYKIEMSDSRSTLFMDWINRAKLAKAKEPLDCRWGLLFIGRDGKEIASIFSDKFGRLGNVDGHDVEFSDTRLLDTIHAVVGPEVRYGVYSPR